MRRLFRALVGALALGVLAAGAGALPAGAGQSRAVVVIDTGGSVRSAQITFSGTISGLQALQLAGAGPATYGYSGQGLAVCSLDGVGHPATGDACLGTPGDPRYWAYHRAPSGSTGWSYSRGSAGGATVADGDVEGWRFGTGQAPRVAVCSVKDCAPPPAPPPPAPAPPAPAAPGQPAPGGGAAATSDPGPVAGPGGAVSPDGAAGSADPPAATDDGPATTTPPTTRPSAGTRPEGTSSRRALGARPTLDEGDDGGSPVGVLVAGGLVAAIGGTAVVLRRRGRAPG